jgi:hypothetical protein
VNGKVIMKESARTRRAARAALAGVCLLAAIALAGCSKKVTSVDASYTTPEGVPSGSVRLVVYPDLPITITSWVDRVDNNSTPPGASGTWNPQTPTDPSGDSLVATSEPIYAIGPGVIRGVLVDGTQATGFQVLRREANGGLRSLFDFTLLPARRWLDSGNELYSFTDSDPSGFSPASYIARGLLNGQIAEASPVSNEAQLTGSTVADLNYTGNLFPADSLFLMSWDPVPGAAGYWIHVYDFVPAATEIDRRIAGTPAPLSTTLTRDFYLAYTDASVTSHKIGSGGVAVLTFRPNEFRFQREYNVRISAVDANGRLIACTLGGDPRHAFVRPSRISGQINVSPRGAAKVSPTR